MLETFIEAPAMDAAAHIITSCRWNTQNSVQNRKKERKVMDFVRKMMDFVLTSTLPVVRNILSTGFIRAILLSYSCCRATDREKRIATIPKRRICEEKMMEKVTK